MIANFYYKVCYNNLFKYYITIFRNKSIDRIIKFLLSFNSLKILHANNNVDIFRVAMQQAFN